MILNPTAAQWTVEVRPETGVWGDSARGKVAIILNMERTPGPETTGPFLWFRRYPGELDDQRFIVLAAQVGPIRVARRAFDGESRDWLPAEWLTVGRVRGTGEP